MKHGFWSVMRRELGRVGGSLYYPVLLVVLPLLSFAILVAIFRSGVPRDLPIAVVDLDHTALSRQASRMIDATPSMRVAFQAASAQEARSLVLENKAYALVMIPEDFERDVRRAASPKVVGYYNAQYLLPASLIRRDLRGAIATLSAGLELRVREARGETPKGAMAHLEPIRLDSHTLFNPQLNYAYFLVAALLPTMLQIFVTIGTVHAVGIELKESTAGEWLATAGNRSWSAVTGKLLPYTVYFILLGLVMLGVLFRLVGVPLQGNVPMIAAGTVLFVLAYQAVGLFIIAWFANLRFATSSAAVYCTPAFAFVGVTYPAIGMPTFGRLCRLPCRPLLPLSPCQD
jgi:ABC-2 type transport system permease protein